MKRALQLVLLITVLIFLVDKPPVLYCQVWEDELGTRMVVAFVAVAEAESKGGDVSGLVDDLQKALSLLEKGGAEDLEEAEALIEAVLVQVSEVERKGVALTLYKRLWAAAMVSFIAVSAFLVWRFGPRVFWSIWLRSKRDWRVQA